MWPTGISVAELDFDVSAADVAVTVIVAPPEGSVVGAVYVIAVPLGVEFVESVPHGAVGQETAHVISLLLTALLTVAASCTVVAACTTAVAGETETEIAGTVTVAVAVFVGSATEAAMRVTFTLFAGGAAGAV